MLGVQIGMAAGQASVSRTAMPGTSHTDRMITGALGRHDTGDHSSASRETAGGGPAEKAISAVADGGTGGAAKRKAGGGTSHQIPI
jgi:hypothetical protein